MNNNSLIDKAVEIAVARMSNTTLPPDKEGGECVAAFMQAIYDKLSELNTKED